MGGSAFTLSHPSISIVRLTPSQYTYICPILTDLLSQSFTAIVIPPAAPEKPFHGDIDVLVYTANTQTHASKIANLLDARARIQNGPESHFAVPLVKFLVNTGSSSEVEGKGEKDDCFQLDIRSCPSLASYEWQKTMRCYGDLWIIVRACASHHELIIDDKSLSLRIQGIAKASKKNGLLRLTSSMSGLMSFMGLDQKRFESGFETLDDVFEWVVKGRFFARDIFEAGKRNRENPVVTGKAKREKKQWERWMMQEFTDVWLPGHPEVGRDLTLSKAMAAEGALETFGKRGEYESMFQKHRKLVRRNQM